MVWGCWMHWLAKQRPNFQCTSFVNTVTKLILCARQYLKVFKKKSNDVKIKTCRLSTSTDFSRLRKEWKGGQLGALRSQLRAYGLCTLQQRQFDMAVLYQTEATTSAVFLDFKLSSWCEFCILCFGWFPGVWILCTDVSEHSVRSIFIGGVNKKNNWKKLSFGPDFS